MLLLSLKMSGANVHESKGPSPRSGSALPGVRDGARLPRLCQGLPLNALMVKVVVKHGVGLRVSQTRRQGLKLAGLPATIID